MAGESPFDLSTSTILPLFVVPICVCIGYCVLESETTLTRNEELRYRESDDETGDCSWFMMMARQQGLMARLCRRCFDDGKALTIVMRHSFQPLPFNSYLSSTINSSSPLLYL
jgi:hypothetical protein